MKSTKAKCKSILKENGVFLNNTQLPKAKEEDLLFLKDLIESDNMKPVIDRVYSIEQIVEAHEYVDKGHKKGNVVITID
jgi:NADPH:quinone reductase-like Zn-dependent oxidoreductase